MGKLFSVWHFVCRFKYVFIILFAALLIGFLDDNSLLIRSRRWQRIAELRREIADYEERFDAANTDLDGTAALCEEQGVVAKAAIAKKALPECNIVCLTGGRAQDQRIRLSAGAV